MNFKTLDINLENEQHKFHYQPSTQTSLSTINTNLTINHQHKPHYQPSTPTSLSTINTNLTINHQHKPHYQPSPQTSWFVLMVDSEICVAHSLD
jgi:hypothetical protein